MRPVLGGVPFVVAAMAIAQAAPTAAPICPHCRKPVGPTLDEQHTHATGRCVTPTPSEPNRAREFLDRQLARNIENGRRLRDERRRAAEAIEREQHQSAAKRIEKAIAKRQRKAQHRSTP